TGYGNALNTLRAVREFERAGVAALHLEDQTFPKRCGHYDDKSVIAANEMAQKLRAARDATGDAELVLIARTDALAIEGLDAPIAWRRSRSARTSWTPPAGLPATRDTAGELEASLSAPHR